jgi:hypothetical protein
MSHISSILIILIVRTCTSKYHHIKHRMKKQYFKADLIDLMLVKSISLLAYFGSVVFHGTQEVVAPANRNKHNDKN